MMDCDAYCDAQLMMLACCLPGMYAMWRRRPLLCCECCIAAMSFSQSSAKHAALLRWAEVDAFLADWLHVIVYPYREKAQLVLLLRTLKLSIERPFQRLPTLTALFLAEAACALAHPAADMYPVLNRHLLRRATLDLQVSCAAILSAVL